jgi:hypothetical protein
VSNRGLVVLVDGRRMISIIVGITLVAAGAILRFAVPATFTTTAAPAAGHPCPAAEYPPGPAAIAGLVGSHRKLAVAAAGNRCLISRYAGTIKLANFFQNSPTFQGGSQDFPGISDPGPHGQQAESSCSAFAGVNAG